jgi:hypothetical protein
VWAVGLVAHRLLWAGKGQYELGLLNKHIAHRMNSWADKLSDGALENDQDLGSLVDPSSLDHKIHTRDLLVSDPKLNTMDRRLDATVRIYDLSEHVPIYSIGLIRIIRDCLQYHPEQRPNLLQMKDIIDSAITRLDNLYGTEIQKLREDTSRYHRVIVEEEKWAAFDLGQQYEPPRKRRRVSISSESTKGADYIRHVDEWSDISTRPSPEQQADAIIAIETWLDTPKNRHHCKEEPRLQPCFQYLRACIMHRVVPDEPTHVVTKWEHIMVQSFTPVARRDLARLLIGTIIPQLLGDESLSELHDTLRVMSHAARWAELLMVCTGEPILPVLNDKTELHRGFRDWVMIQPYDINHISSDSESE